jgi:hypothetical protein
MDDRFIKRSFALPMHPLTPAVPNILILSDKYQQHSQAIKQFLDTIPRPFTYHIEDAEGSGFMNQIMYMKAEAEYKKHKAAAEKDKLRGNEAFRRGDGKAAIEAYTHSLRNLEDAKRQKVPEEKKKEIMHLMAQSCSNRSAAALLPGESRDIQLAIGDGQKAIFADPSFVKGLASSPQECSIFRLIHLHRYVRLARAYQVNGKLEDAQSAIADALCRPEFADNEGLVDLLIELQTNGRGVPTRETEFKSWVVDTQIGDVANVKRMNGVEGAYKRRIEGYLESFKKQKT